MEIQFIKRPGKRKSQELKCINPSGDPQVILSKREFWDSTERTVPTFEIG
jgi:hypothetical protein